MGYRPQVFENGLNSLTPLQRDEGLECVEATGRLLCNATEALDRRNQGARTPTVGQLEAEVGTLVHAKSHAVEPFLNISAAWLQLDLRYAFWMR